MNVHKEGYTREVASRGQYTMIANEIFERQDLGHLAKLVWCYITSQRPNWSSSRNNLARNLGIDRETVSKHVTQLIEKNLLRVRNGARGSWEFEIVPPSRWAEEPTGINSDQSEDPASSDWICRPHAAGNPNRKQATTPPTLNIEEEEKGSNGETNPSLKGEGDASLVNENEQTTLDTESPKEERDPPKLSQSASPELRDRESMFDRSNPSPSWIARATGRLQSNERSLR